MNHGTCGTQDHRPDSELRHATILKCDLVDSTRIMGKLDPSDGLALSRALRKAVEEGAARFGAHMERWEGDGALLSFGYPDAREDGPEAAVRAGIELLRAVQQIDLADEKLLLRVGIASDSIAIDLVSRSLEGLAINLAERLKTSADPGSIVIATTTKELSGNYFEYQDLGLRELKGFPHPVQAWRVLGATEVVSRYDAQRLQNASNDVISRSTELTALAEAWSCARAGSGQFVRIVGAAGLGKSRLAKAVCGWAAQDRATVLEIDCAPSAGNSPLYPVGVLLRRRARIGLATADADKERLARELLSSMIDEPAMRESLTYLAPLFGLQDGLLPSDFTPDQIRDQTLAWLVRLCRGAAARAPLLIICEDMHWADATTAGLIQRIADGIADARALLIVTTRPESSIAFDPEHMDTRRRELLLEPLVSSAAADLVCSVARGADLPQDLVRAIIDRCEGVPLLLEELTRNALEASMALPRGAPAPRHGVPAMLRLVVESRLERLQPHKRPLQAAAVLGREFSIGVLQSMLPDIENIGSVLDVLADHGLLARRAADAEDRARFTHAMIRDAVYETLIRDDRRRLHSRAADLLAGPFGGSSEASPDLIAQHLFEAARYMEAVQIRLQASGDTVKRGAYVEAEGHCRAALLLVEQIGSEADQRMLSFQLLVQLGVALTGQHGYSAPQVEEVYRKARNVCGHRAEAEMLYPIMRGLTALNLVRGNLEVGFKLSEQSKEVAEQSQQAAFRIDALSVHCYAIMYYGRLDTCRAEIERCLALYEQERGDRLVYPVPNDAGLAALAILPTVEWLLGDSHAAEYAIRRGLDHVSRTNRDFDKAYLYAWIAGLRFTQRRYQESSESAQIAIAISQKNGFKEWYVTGLLLDLLAQASLNAAPEALKLADDTMQAMAREGVGLNASWYLWGLARGHRTAGNLDEARRLVQNALYVAEASRETRMNPELILLKAELEDDAAVAARLLIEAVGLADSQGAVTNSLRAMAALVLRFDTQEPTRHLARDTYEILEGRAVCPETRGWMHARLASLREAHARARETLASA